MCLNRVIGSDQSLVGIEKVLKTARVGCGSTFKSIEFLCCTRRACGLLIWDGAENNNNPRGCQFSLQS